MSFCVCMNMWICENDCDYEFFRLGTALHLSQYMGVVAIAPWLGSVSKCQRWVVVGEGLQCPALGNGFLARKAVVSLVLLHLLPLFLLRRLPQSRLSLVTYPSPSQGQVCLLLPFLACPLLPPPSYPQSILHGRPQCPPWLLSGPALMPCLFPSRWEQVLCVGSKPAQTRGLYNQQAALKVLCHALELPQ